MYSNQFSLCNICKLNNAHTPKSMTQITSMKKGLQEKDWD